MQELPALLPVPVPAKPRADPKLALTIAVAGWIAAPGDFEDVWRHLSTTEAERFTLVWETKELIQLNNSIMNMLLNQVWCASVPRPCIRYGTPIRLKQ